MFDQKRPQGQGLRKLSPQNPDTLHVGPKMVEDQGLKKLSPQNPDTRHVDILTRIT